MQSLLTPIRREWDEASLDAFRAGFLDPLKIIAEMQAHMRVALQLPPGIGKSHLADELMAESRLYERYDLVLYLAPRLAVVDERRIVIAGASTPAPVPWTRLLGRPRADCGPLNPAWSDFEARGLSVLAKEQLCKRCPRHDTCAWRKRLTSPELKNAKLVFGTEAQLTNNPGLLALLQSITGAPRVLAIFDEAQFLDKPFSLAITRQDLVRFQAAARTSGADAGDVRACADLIDDLLGADINALVDRDWPFPILARADALAIQTQGTRMFPASFKYSGYHLRQLAISKPADRFWDGDGNLVISARPMLDAKVLVLSANVSAEYAQHRLGGSPVHSPFAGVTFRHSGTRIYNIKSSSGSWSYFQRNAHQIVDFFAALIHRNLKESRTTLLITKKDLKADYAAMISAQLGSWGANVRIEADLTQLPAKPDPSVIPLIHFGIVGVNDFIDYETAYCLGGYYVNDAIIRSSLFEGDRPGFEVEVAIHTDSAGNRRVEIPDSRHKFSGTEPMANLYLRKLEIDPVLQAVGRVRFYTKPREVIFFQMHDLAPFVGDVIEFRSISQARRAFGLSTGTQLTRSAQRQRLQELIDQGVRIAEAAKQLGISRSKAYELLKSG